MSQPLSLQPGPWLASLKGLFFPPACLVCNRSMGISAEAAVCPDCQAGLKPGRVAVSGELSGGELDDLFALYFYGSGARKIIHRIKLTGDPRAGRWLRSELKRAGALTRSPRFDLIVPIPSHRRTGPFAAEPQTSSVWAETLGEHLRVPIARAVVRVRTVVKQTRLRRDLRLALSESSLGVRGSALKGCRSVLLADDVLTTGATARACARLLKRRGVERVAVAVIARG